MPKESKNVEFPAEDLIAKEVSRKHRQVQWLEAELLEMIGKLMNSHSDHDIGVQHGIEFALDKIKVAFPDVGDKQVRE